MEELKKKTLIAGFTVVGQELASLATADTL